MAALAFHLNQLPLVPWKNGGGVTRELVCMPAGAGLGDFDWRVSIADITQSGPFSRFAGIDRCIVLLDGAGVMLQGEAGLLHRLDTVGVPFAFAGDGACHATLLGTASRDLNVMTRRSRYRQQVCVETTRLARTGQAGIWLVLAGEWLDAAGRYWMPGEGLCWPEPDDEVMSWTPTSTASQVLQVIIEERLS